MLGSPRATSRASAWDRRKPQGEPPTQGPTGTLRKLRCPLHLSGPTSLEPHPLPPSSRCVFITSSRAELRRGGGARMTHAFLSDGNPIHWILPWITNPRKRHRCPNTAGVTKPKKRHRCPNTAGVTPPNQSWLSSRHPCRGRPFLSSVSDLLLAPHAGGG